MENSTAIPQKNFKVEHPDDPAISLLSIYPKKMKTLIQKDICTTPIFTVALCTTAKIWKQPKCPSTDKWIKKMWYIYIYFSHKKEWNLAICNDMYGPRWYYAKWNNLDRERQILYNIIYMWNLKSKTNEQTKQKQSHRYREQTDGCQRGRNGGEERNRWERLRGTNFQSENKWVKGMKCMVWGIQSITM